MSSKSLFTFIFFGTVLALGSGAFSETRAAAPAAPKFCWLDTVVDGDTLRVTCQGQSVSLRLHCIDAPEKAQTPWGDRSREALRRITPRLLQVVPVETDRYGRTVAKVYTASADHRLLNLEQVRTGNAAVYARYCDDAQFTRAEKEAKSARRGIWSRAGDQQKPWAFRHR